MSNSRTTTTFRILQRTNQTNIQVRMPQQGRTTEDHNFFLVKTLFLPPNFAPQLTNYRIINPMYGTVRIMFGWTPLTSLKLVANGRSNTAPYCHQIKFSSLLQKSKHRGSSGRWFNSKGTIVKEANKGRMNTTPILVCKNKTQQPNNSSLDKTLKSSY